MQYSHLVHPESFYLHDFLNLMTIGNLSDLKDGYYYFRYQALYQEYIHCY